jgi:hypothetical protein
MIKLLASLVVITSFTGCASVMNEVNQPVKIETKTSAGELVAGADCKLTNDYGVVNMKSGDTAQVHRSNKDLEIVCQSPTNPNAVARAISRTNGGMFGNIILGGGIGAVVDHNRGTAYTYPTWLQLVFGQTLEFDRRAQKDAEAIQGTTPVAVK